MFAYLSPDDIEVSPEQIAFYKSRGYDMKAWRNYERLIVNDKLPKSRSFEPLEKMYADMATARRKTDAALR